MIADFQSAGQGSGGREVTRLEFVRPHTDKMDAPREAVPLVCAPRAALRRANSPSMLALVLLLGAAASAAPGTEQGECSGPATCGRTAGAPGGSKKVCAMEPGVDYPGGVCNERICTGSDLEYIKDVQTPKRCCRRCHRHPQCVYWTHANADRRPQWQRLGCWLKTVDAGPTRRADVTGTLTSGFIRERIQPPPSPPPAGLTTAAAANLAANVPRAPRDTPQDPGFSTRDAALALAPGSPGAAAECKATRTPLPQPRAGAPRPSQQAERRSEALAEEAHAEFRAGNMPAAVRLFAEAVQENESNGWALLRHAIALERSAQRRQAAQAYTRALAAEWPALEGKEVAIAHNNLGLQLYEVMGEEASAGAASQKYSQK